MIGSIVQFVGEFVVCQDDNCHQAVSIHHKKHFPQHHFDHLDGKRVTHKSMPFDESLLWKNFCHLVRFETIVTRNLNEGLRGLGLANQQGYVESILYNSQLMGEVFGGSEQAIREYFYLREIQKGSHK